MEEIQPLLWQFNNRYLTASSSWANGLLQGTGGPTLLAVKQGKDFGLEGEDILMDSSSGQTSNRQLARRIKENPWMKKVAWIRE